MRQSEKQAMINKYEEQFKYYLLSGEQSETEKTLLNGMKAMMELFFSKAEIMDIENRMRVTALHKISDFESIESWMRQIEKEKGVKSFPFEWTVKGLDKVDAEYDYLYSEYKGFKLAIDFAYKTLQKEAA